MRRQDEFVFRCACENRRTSSAHPSVFASAHKRKNIRQRVCSSVRCYLKLKRAVAFVVLTVLLWVSFPVAAFAEHRDYTTDDLFSVMEGIIGWKKQDENTKGDLLSSPSFLEKAGTTAADWYAFSLGRLGYEDDYASYLAVIADDITKRYAAPEKLDSAKATEWHRISLAVLSAGGDPTAIGRDAAGKPIDLIADGTYNRGLVSPLGQQGINGYIFALIAMDSFRYIVPENAQDTRDGIITSILSAQTDEGGFSLSSDTPAPDLTAMAVQALAPYYNSEQTHTYSNASGVQVTKNVRQAIDHALAYLSAAQTADGHYMSFGESSVEAAAQVLAALCSLGINPTEDARFIKKGNTLLDVIMRYRQNDGGFVHSFAYDEDNPAANPDTSNTMAGEQVLYALTALVRRDAGLRTLYDCRPETDDALKERIRSLTKRIDALPASPAQTDSETVRALFAAYLDIPVEERSYVSNYHLLADAMQTLNIENTSEYLSKYMDQNTSGNGAIVNVFSMEVVEPDVLFNASNLSEYDALTDPPTTAQYVTVIKLIDKINNAENGSDYQDILLDLENKKAQITLLQQEIESINAEVLEELYPFENISLKDKEVVQSIIERINNLHPVDRQQVLRYEDIEKAYIQIDNLQRAVVIGAVFAVIAVVVVVIVLFRIRKRRREKQQRKMADGDI
jgi:hypothetical protein